MCNDTGDVIPEDDEVNEASTDDVIAEVIDLEAQKRLWVRAIIPLLQLKSRNEDVSGRVQLAMDMMHVAACERVRRLLRSDLPDEPD